MPDALYLETSAVLQALLETGTSRELEKRIAGARALVTSRLTLVETARALLRLRAEETVPEDRLAGAARELDALWARCEIWELTGPVCDLAAQVAPTKPLRTPDALHVATYLLARRRLGDIALLTADRRLEDAAGTT